MEADPITANHWRIGPEPFPLDELLRQHGWRLAPDGRPKGEESIWQRDEITCRQSFALELLMIQYGWERVGTKWRNLTKTHGTCTREAALQSLIEWCAGSAEHKKRRKAQLDP